MFLNQLLFLLVGRSLFPIVFEFRMDVYVYIPRAGLYFFRVNFHYNLMVIGQSFLLEKYLMVLPMFNNPICHQFS